VDCQGFIETKGYPQRKHYPDTADLTEDAPTNSSPSRIRVCRDKRGAFCAYYYRLNLVSDDLIVDEGLCLYGNRKIVSRKTTK